MAVTDAEKLRQLLYILLDNARKYSDGEVKTVINENEVGITISVIDYGNGIPEDALPHIFNRFYRWMKTATVKQVGLDSDLPLRKNLQMDSEQN